MVLHPQSWKLPNFVISNTFFKKKILLPLGLGGVVSLGLVTYSYLTTLSQALITDAEKYYQTGNYGAALHKLKGAETYLRFASSERRPQLTCQIQVYRGAVFAHQHQPTAAINLLAENIENCHSFPELVAFAQGTIAQRSNDLLALGWQAHTEKDYERLLAHAAEVQPYLPHLAADMAQNLRCQFTSLEGSAFSHLGRPDAAIGNFKQVKQLCEPTIVDFANKIMLERVRTLKVYAHQSYAQGDYNAVLGHVNEADPYFKYLGYKAIGEPYCELVTLKGATFYQTQQYDQALPIFSMAIGRCQPFQPSMQRAHISRSHIYRQQADQLWTDQKFPTSQERYRQALKDLDGFRQQGGHLDAVGLLQRSTMKLRVGDLVGSIRDYGFALKLNREIIRQFYDAETVANYDSFVATPPNLSELLNQLQKHNVRLAVAKLPTREMGTFDYHFTYWSHNYQIISASTRITIDIYKHDNFLEFINTLNHEAIHMAQTCKANHGRPYGFNELVVIDPKYKSPLAYTPLEEFINENYDPADIPIEREAYELSWEPDTALKMVKAHCK